MLSGSLSMVALLSLSLAQLSPSLFIQSYFLEMLIEYSIWSLKGQQALSSFIIYSGSCFSIFHAKYNKEKVQTNIKSIFPCLTYTMLQTFLLTRSHVSIFDETLSGIFFVLDLKIYIYVIIYLILIPSMILSDTQKKDINKTSPRVHG